MEGLMIKMLVTMLLIEMVMIMSL